MAGSDLRYTGSGNVQETRASNGFAVTALVCGIVGILIFEIILGPLAIIFGAVGLRRAGRAGRGRGMAMAGLILGIIDVVLFFIFLAVASRHGGFSWHVGG
jgi:hypothetical protein